MKRIGHLWDELVSFENLYLAYRKARRGKRRHRSVEQFEYRREQELARLQEELSSGTYRPGDYRTFTLHDSKPRMISAAPFRDRIVHHALCNVVEPIFERSFIFDSYASRKGKGTHAAIARYQEFARRNAYVLKCDIRKFFPSIDHAILKGRLARKIKDPQVLALASLIIDGSNPQIAVPGYFPGDDLFTAHERRRGLPIGNQTSQFFGNVYLDGLDHFVKEQLGCRCYLRYVDDFVILDDDKHRLAELRSEVDAFLRTARLWLHPTKRAISRTGDGVRLLGFRVWPRRVWLDKGYVRRVRARFHRYRVALRQRRSSWDELRQRVQAWLGHMRTLGCSRYPGSVLRDIVFKRTTTEQPLAPRGFVEQQRQEHPLRQPQQERAREPEQQHWVPALQHSTGG